MSYDFTTGFEGRRSFPARRFGGSEDVAADEFVVVETPVALVFSGRPFAVTSATPTNLADFACGFALTEGIVDDVADIEFIEIRRERSGIEVWVEIPRDRAMALDDLRRPLVGRPGRGHGGVDRFREARRGVTVVNGALRVSPKALRRAVADLSRLRGAGAASGTGHGAAFADATGAIRLSREDAGRHNALDKLIGALFAGDVDPAGGFVLVSSRCSHDMVRKTAAAGIGLIASTAAPTSLAIELADEARVGLVGHAREGRFTVYATPWRVVEDDEVRPLGGNA
ncbi:MAG: formate dehydrogenase accessory sulfurtransferase FdhD [Phyllobacteriaceae bacterium]|nr:formate dehydrogenase accessory sulfurtransferase FdhD [Phyllobacteriaceae bacterium]